MSTEGQESFANLLVASSRISGGENLTLTPKRLIRRGGIEMIALYSFAAIPLLCLLRLRGKTCVPASPLRSSPASASSGCSSELCIILLEFYRRSLCPRSPWLQAQVREGLSFHGQPCFGGCTIRFRQEPPRRVLALIRVGCWRIYMRRR